MPDLSKLTGATEIFSEIQNYLSSASSTEKEEQRKKFNTIFQFDVKLKDGSVKTWLADLKNEIQLLQGDLKGIKPEATIALSESDFVQLATGKLNGQKAFMSGKLKIKGNIMQGGMETETHEGQIRCLCKSSEDDGFTIQCEACLDWQHASCMGFDAQNIPEQYFCEKCNATFNQQSDFMSMKKRKVLPALSASLFDLHLGTECQEITENMVKSDLAQKALDQLIRDCRLQKDKSDSFKRCLVLPDASLFKESFSKVQLREIRNRGYQKKNVASKYGIFADQEFQVGDLVVEFVGVLSSVKELEIVEEETVNGSLGCNASYMLGFVKYQLILDAREYGNIARFARKSCRPNVELKIVLLSSTPQPLVKFGLFATCNIAAAEEISLAISEIPFSNVRVDCTCGNGDLCLSPFFVEKMPSKIKYKGLKRNLLGLKEKLKAYQQMKKECVKKLFAEQKEFEWNHGEFNQKKSLAVKDDSVEELQDEIEEENEGKIEEKEVKEEEEAEEEEKEKEQKEEEKDDNEEKEEEEKKDSNEHKEEISSLSIMAEDSIYEAPTNEDSKYISDLLDKIFEGEPLDSEEIKAQENALLVSLPKKDENSSSTPPQLLQSIVDTPTNLSTPEKERTRVSFSDYIKKRRSVVSNETTPESKKSRLEEAFTASNIGEDLFKE